MQKNVYDFVEKVVLDNCIKGNILDVGSLDINGSVKSIFKESVYLGIDLRKGKNVDIVMDSHNLSTFSDGFFDCVVCLEMLEHDSNPFLTIKEIYRLLPHNGLFILCVPGIEFPKHDCPADYWRFTKDGIKVLLRDFQIIEIKEEDKEVFCLARK